MLYPVFYILAELYENLYHNFHGHLFEMGTLYSTF